MICICSHCLKKDGKIIICFLRFLGHGLMSIIKEKLEIKTQARWPYLWRLVEKGVLLHIDYAYAEKRMSDESECKAALQCVLMAISRLGHLCLKVEDQIQPPLSEITTDPQLETLVREAAGKEKVFYLPKYEALEKEIVNGVKRLLELPKKQMGEMKWEPALTNEQKLGVSHALTCPLSLITGGPGTGKTFVATQIVQSFIEQGKDSVILTAPTGKAAAHLESKLNISQPSVRSGTLHNFLQVRSVVDYAKDVEGLDADLVIVDECSMIDTQVFARLLKSIESKTHLVLMGDANQLPAVEGGAIFRDLIDSKIPKTTLTYCHRIDRKEILDLAESILKAEAKDLKTLDLGFEKNDLKLIYKNLLDYAEEFFPKAESWMRDLNRFRILSTLRKGPLGVDALNALFFKHFSSKTTHLPIMIRKNDSKTGLCNGDTGILINNQRAVFEGGKTFHLHQLPSFEYAYCLSVHKSQGSEFDHVLLLVPEGSESFGREVLYTAVTRAKLRLEIEGNEEQMALALKKISRKISGIGNRL